MKSKIKTFIVVFVLFISGIIGGFTKVSAAVEFPLPQKYWSNAGFNYTYPNGIDYENFCDDFFNYSGLNASDYFLIIATGTAVYESGRMYIYPYERNSVVTAYSDSSHRYLYLKSFPTTIYYCNNSTLTGFHSITYSDFSRYPRSFCYDNTNQVYRQCVLETNGNWSNLEYNDIPVSVINQTVLTFTPTNHTFYGLDLSINDTSFYEWIIQNNKLSELPSYVTQSKLLSFIKFYNNYGGSFVNFVKNIPDWFSQMNILNQTSENVNILKSSMDRLYQEYFNSFWVEVGKHSAETLPHHRRNIQTQTTDDDTTLITDDQNDTLIESILRDILRGIIQISNQIGDGVKSIIDKLSQLNFTTTVVNNGGNNDTDTDVEGIDSDISDTMADSIEDVPQLDTEVPNLLSAPAVVGSTVNIYLTVFQSMGLDKILIFAVTVSFLIIKIRGNTK